MLARLNVLLRHDSDPQWIQALVFSFYDKILKSTSSTGCLSITNERQGSHIASMI